MSAPPAPRCQEATPAETEPVPQRLLFVWLGSSLPLFAELALRSAVHHHPNWEVLLWHSPELSPEPRARLASLGVVCRPIHIEQLLGSAAAVLPEGAPPLGVGLLGDVYYGLSTPAARANLIRLLALYTHGGVYLDTDTLTLRDLSPLLPLSAFCGQEHLLWPRRKLNLADSYFWVLGPILSAARWVCAHTDSGYRRHRQLLPWYSTAANNAVLGFRPAHPLLRGALERISEMAPRERQRRFRLGTHLLQEMLERPAPGPAARVHQLPPSAFYPLGPVISGHYFRPVADVARVARELLAETYVVHWYASVSDLRALDQQYLREHAQRTLYAHLCAPHMNASDGSHG